MHEDQKYPQPLRGDKILGRLVNPHKLGNPKVRNILDLSNLTMISIADQSKKI